jgi:hypothetical protein
VGIQLRQERHAAAQGEEQLPDGFAADLEHLLGDDLDRITKGPKGFSFSRRQALQ